MKRFYSVPSVFGGKDYYNEDGEKVGWSAPSIIDGEVIYNFDGEKVGWSNESVFGGENFFMDEDAFSQEEQSTFRIDRMKDSERDRNADRIRKKFLEDPWDEIINP